MRSKAQPAPSDHLPPAVRTLVSGADRLASLVSFDVLDTPPEPGFDGIVQLASRLCQAPIALVSLVDADRQWFKARVGFPPHETDLRSSICAHALAEPDLLVIPDLRHDLRTADNPLVTPDDGLRFYAGAPLRSAEGAALGTLSVLDHTPRPQGLDPKQAADLRLLAQQVVTQLELRRTLAARDRLLVQQAASDRERRLYVETSRAIGAAEGKLDAILLHLVEGVMAAVPGADAGVMEMVDGDDLVYRVARGAAQGSEGTRVPIGGSIAGLCARTGQPLVIADVRGDPRAAASVAARLDIRSALLAPVTRGGQVLGVLKLHASRPGIFSTRDLDVVQLFAEAASTGLTEAREAAAQRAVHASETRYQAVFDSAVDYAMIVLDLQGHVTDWNSGAARILGWTAAEMQGRSADMFFTPDDRAAGLPALEMKNALATGRSADERWHLRKSGEQFWANGEIMTLRDRKGEAIGFLKIMRDRTEEHASFERLQASEQQLSFERSLLQSVVHQAPVGISVAHADGRTMFNASVRRMLGHGPEHAAAGAAASQAEHADGRRYTTLDDPALRALKDGVRIEAEVMRYRHAETQELRRWEVTSTPIRDAAGGIVAAVSVFVDVEDELAASEALLASEQRLQLALSASGLIGWYDWHVGQDRVYAGEHFARMFGVDPALAARGAPMAAFLAGIHPADRASTEQRIAEAMAGTGDYEAEYRLSNAGDRTIWVHAIGRVTSDAAGRPKRFSGLVSDITGHKLAAERQAAVIEMGDRLRDLTSVAAITREAAAIVGRTLGVTRAGYGRLDASKEWIEVEPDWTSPGVPSIAGRHRFDDYGDIRGELIRGEPLVIDDVHEDRRTAADPEPMLRVGVQALVNMPVRERGETVAVFIAHDDRPRRWTCDELSFLRTVADRVEVGVARLAAEHQQTLLNHELSHRLKNTLAMVQAIVTQTLRNTTDMAAAKVALVERLAALSQAHEILMTGTAVSAPMAAVIRGAIQLHEDPGAERFHLDGPVIDVNARAALSLALMMHELATNATKYGALKTGSGQVEIVWTISGDPGLEIVTLTWAERGGPSVAPPMHIGFGSKLIQRGLAGAVGGEVDVDYRATGLLCTLRAPLSGFTNKS